MKKLIAFVDGSVYSQSVCDHAAWIASRSDSSIILLHVLGRRDVSATPTNMSGSIGLGARTAILEELAELDGQKARLAQKRARAILEDAKSSIRNDGVEDVSAVLRNDEMIETLVEYENDADLVVIGKRGEAADFDTMHLGSNLERVVRSSKRPILSVSRAFKPIKNFLVAFDGGASSMKAVSHVANSSALEGLQCHLVSASEPKVDVTQRMEGAAALLRDAGFEVTTEITPGHAEKVIGEKIERDSIDLLLMGAYGHSRIRNLIIGSTTTEMVRSCKIPVLLFR